MQKSQSALLALVAGGELTEVMAIKVGVLKDQVIALITHGVLFSTGQDCTCLQ